MNLSKQEFNELLEYATMAAILASKIIKNAKPINSVLKLKSDKLSHQANVVTETDLLAQKEIIKTLSPTIKKYDLGLLTEETLDDSSRLKKDYFWCIDPLDGTLSFGKGIPGYCVSISLISKQGDPIIGVIVNPTTNCVYSGIKGQGAKKNGKSFSRESLSQNNFLSVMHDESFFKYDTFEIERRKLINIATNLNLVGVKFFNKGGAVINAVNTIEQSPAIYYKLPQTKPGGGSLWDFGASAIIQSEANGYCSDYHHNSLELNKESDTFMGHNGVIYASNENLAKMITAPQEIGSY